MGSLYYVEAAELLRAAGLTVFETDGWERRARSSGGFDAPPLGVQWHHTAGNMNLEANLEWQTTGCEDAPVGNMLLWDDGNCYMVAAGAANTAGKGGPVTLSRGVVGQDKGNTTTWAIEAANNGVGQPWPQAQIDAYFTITITLNAHFGNRPEDLFTHKSYTDASCPGRKVDPATAAAIQGPWQPRSDSTSGTWHVEDIWAEAIRRAEGTTPPPPTNGDEVTDEDIERIAQRVADVVWAERFTTDKGPQTAGWILGQDYVLTQRAVKVSEEAAANTRG